tara:strand:+ start:1296 stop:1988 length:693 start_codon:yes stop_codon:yes gene_type:complete
MQFFIRRYLKGLKGSGTDDLFVSEDPISHDEFENISHTTGEGKYLLCARGKGIRGFKKLSEFIVGNETPLAFTAETVQVKKNLDLSLLSEEELIDLMGNMIKQAPTTPETQEKFKTDLISFHAELATRRNTPINAHAAEDALVSAGFPIGTTVTSFILGALSGGIVVWLIQKNAIDDLKGQIASLEGTIKEAETAIESVKKKTEELEKKSVPTVDELFMADFNRMNGWNR